MRKWIFAAALPVAIAGVTLGTLWAQGRASGTAWARPGEIQSDERDSQGLEAWRRDLEQADLAERERAFERAVRAARRDRDLEEALRRWADEGGELAWTSRLALRELERSRPFGDLDPWGPGMGPDLEAWMERFRGGDLHERFARPRAGGLQPPAAPAPGVRRELDQFSLKVTPDGVEATVTRDVDGEKVTETYEAASVEELLQAHPELADRISVGPLGGMDFRLSPGLPLDVPWPDLDLGQSFRIPFDLRGWGDPAWGHPASGEVRTDVLGVAVRPPTDQESAERGVEPGIGLYVERVERRTMAERMGLRPGDLLLEINGREIATRADVASALAERAPRGEVRVELVEPGGEHRTRTWRPGLEPLRQL
jgi:hypothetical protein